MPGWNELMDETYPASDDEEEDSGLSYADLRHKYISSLSKYTGRNVITYYSGWLTSSGENNLGISDNDLTGFMNAIVDMDTSKGLDLILHTPGGSAEAAEGIVKYLRSKFGNDIRVFIPQLAMSAGTMLACAGKEIVMGNHSFIGPIDPQRYGISYFDVRDEFDDARSDLAEHPENESYWRILLDKYDAGEYYSAKDAIDLGSELVKEWLLDCMFANEKEADKKINHILNVLNKNNSSHGRHFGIDDCRDMGLKVVALEDDDKLQDAVLSVHHAYMISLEGTNFTKYIENQDGRSYICGS